VPETPHCFADIWRVFDGSPEGRTKRVGIISHEDREEPPSVSFWRLRHVGVRSVNLLDPYESGRDSAEQRRGSVRSNRSAPAPDDERAF
jgi:hypothetical protein